MQIPVAGFTRLKSLFRSGINLIDYDKILSNALNAEVGSLPKDIICKILSGAKKATPVQQISVAKSGLARAIEPLNRGISVAQRANSIFVQNFLQKTLPKDKIISLEFLDDIDLTKLTSQVQPKLNTRGITEASQELTEAFSQVIPNCSKVNVLALNSGCFGMGYKLEFLDSAGEKILHDKVLKLFYKESVQGQGLNMLEDNLPTMLKIVGDFCDNMSKRDIVTMFNNLKTKIDTISTEKIIELLKPYEKELAQNNITITPEQIDEALALAKNLKLKDIKPLFELITKSREKVSSADIKTIFKGIKDQSSRYHGAMAEANTSTYIRSRLGHSLSKTDVVAPDYYDLKRGFAIAEYSDDALPNPTSNVDFSLLGLLHQDLHEGNKVAGRIVDVRGVTSLESLLDDKLTSRYYKKIMNQKNPKCREEYIEYLQGKMKQMNCLDRQKVQNAIDKAKSSTVEWDTPRFELNFTT